MSENVQSAEYSLDVAANTSTVILPPRRNIVADAGWVAEAAVTQGQILYNSENDEYYMVLVAGDLGTEAPDGIYGKPEDNGTAKLIHCFRSPRGRIMAAVTQEADAEIWYQNGDEAALNSGGEFAAFKGQQLRTDYNGSVSAISASDVTLSIKDM